jgi:hypothetical protein
LPCLLVSRLRDAANLARSMLAFAKDGTYNEQMSRHTLAERFEILADTVHCNASCASSGTAKRDAKGGKRSGSTEGRGICHAYAPEGRFIPQEMADLTLALCG